MVSRTYNSFLVIRRWSKHWWIYIPKRGILKIVAKMGGGDDIDRGQGRGGYGEGGSG